MHGKFNGLVYPIMIGGTEGGEGEGGREGGGGRSRLYRIHMTTFPTCNSPGSWEQRGRGYETIHITQEGN